MRIIIIIVIAMSSLDKVFGQQSPVAAVNNAVINSGVTSTDALDSKVALLLHLLNDENYLKVHSPDPQFASFARFDETMSKTKAKALVDQYSRNSSGGPYAPYDLDSDRTPVEMLQQRIGGSCGTHARVFAELLKDTGVPQSNIKIVSAVCTEEYAKFCKSGKDSTVDSEYSGGASGHVFVMVKDGDQWKLINTTFSPFDSQSVSLQKARALEHDAATASDMKTAKEQSLATLRTVTSDDLEMVNFMNPQDLQKQLAAGVGVRVPVFKSLPIALPQGDGTTLHFRQMMIYDVSSPEKYELHKFKDRVDLIASGTKGNGKCRFPIPTSEEFRPRTLPQEGAVIH